MNYSKFSLISIIASAFLCSINANADVILECVFDKYRNSGYGLEQSKGWIPEEQSHIIQSDKISKHVVYGLSGNIMRDNNKRIDFEYKSEHQGSEVTWKYTYFRTTNKVAVKVDFKHHRDIKNVWGKCNETPVDGTDWVNPQNAGDEQLCEEVFLLLPGFSAEIKVETPTGQLVNEVWLNEAKRRWGENYSKEKRDYCHSLVIGVENTSESKDLDSNNLSNLEKAMSSCTELGFTKGTEKHGDCVLKLLD